MKITMYGAPICPACVEAKEKLSNRKDHEITYVNITESTSNLKKFLAYRDKENLFLPVKEGGYIGIPFFVLEDGTMTFDVFEYIGETNLEVEKEDQNYDPQVGQEDLSYEGIACSLDGKGNC